MNTGLQHPAQFCQLCFKMMPSMAALEAHLHAHHSQEVLAPLTISTNYQAAASSLADSQCPTSAFRRGQTSSPTEDVNPDCDKVSLVIY